MTTESLNINPLAVPIPEAVQLSGISRSELYRRLAAGHVRAVKSGARTLILMDSLRAHLASLPACDLSRSERRLNQNHPERGCTRSGGSC